MSQCTDVGHYLKVRFAPSQSNDLSRQIKLMMACSYQSQVMEAKVSAMETKVAATVAKVGKRQELRLKGACTAKASRKDAVT